MNDHIGELAALYALGALDDSERREVDAHVERCDACIRLLAQAQDDVTAIALAQPQHAPPPELAARVAAIATPSATVTHLPVRRRAPSWIAAVAAAVVVALLPSVYFLNQNLAMHRVVVAQADAMARISSSPHRNVAFSGADAHVMYGPDGSWYCVIVRGATRPLHVVWPHDNQNEMLGTAMPHGDVALLYLPKSKRMDRLALMDGEQVVASAQLAFQ